jgi:predicted Holliday junction resolvase-like endonuclease
MGSEKIIEWLIWILILILILAIGFRIVYDLYKDIKAKDKIIKLQDNMLAKLMEELNSHNPNA